jgi:uncharacterized protein (DUF2236 family)
MIPRSDGAFGTPQGASTNPNEFAYPTGGPAVLLQVAHPLVAAGVVDYSDYRRNLWRRLLRTLRALYLIVYGSKGGGRSCR